MLKQLDKEQEAAVAATVEAIEQRAAEVVEAIEEQLAEARRADARKAKARQLIMPTEAEDATITAAALSDPDNQPLTDEQLAQFKPARRGRGRPAQDVTKVLVSIRYDAAVLNSFKSTGEGWQTRMNDALREWAEDHKMMVG